MSAWYRVTLPHKEGGVGGKGGRLQEAFAPTLAACGGRPSSAGLFVERSEDFDELHYYFTPDAARIAAPLIRSYNAVACDRPRRPNPFENQVALLVGDA